MRTMFWCAVSGVLAGKGDETGKGRERSSSYQTVELVKYVDPDEVVVFVSGEGDPFGFVVDVLGLGFIDADACAFCVG